MQPIELINKYYDKAELAKRILLAHSQQVARFAVTVASSYTGPEKVDLQFIEEAALLHDIGKMSIPHDILNKARMPWPASIHRPRDTGCRASEE